MSRAVPGESWPRRAWRRLRGRRGSDAPNPRTALDRFLTTNPEEIGCDQAMSVLHIYVELVLSDPAAAREYAGVAAHLAECGPCAEDFNGLLAAVRAEGW